MFEASVVRLGYFSHGHFKEMAKRQWHSIGDMLFKKDNVDEWVLRVTGYLETPDGQDWYVIDNISHEYIKVVFRRAKQTEHVDLF